MSAATSSEACDEAVVIVILEGLGRDAWRAIGTANVPTLQAAADRCRDALALVRPGKTQVQLHYRYILCRTRINRIREQQKDSF